MTNTNKQPNPSHRISTSTSQHHQPNETVRRGAMVATVFSAGLVGAHITDLFRGKIAIEGTKILPYSSVI